MRGPDTAVPLCEFQGCPRFGRHRAEPSLPSLRTGADPHNNLAGGIYNASSILRRIGGIAFDTLCD